MATSPPPLAASVGPIHFFGCALRKAQVAIGLARFVEQGDGDLPRVGCSVADPFEPGK